MANLDLNALIEFLRRSAGQTGQDFPDIPNIPGIPVGMTPEESTGDMGLPNSEDRGPIGSPILDNANAAVKMETQLSNLMEELIRQQQDTARAREPLRRRATTAMLDPGMLDVGPDIGAAFADPTNPFSTQFNSRDLIQGARGMGGAPGTQTPSPPADPTDFSPIDPTFTPIDPAGPIDRPPGPFDIPQEPAPMEPAPRPMMPPTPVDVPPDQRPLNPKRLPTDPRLDGPPPIPPEPIGPMPTDPRLDGPPPAPVDLPPPPRTPVNPKRGETLDVSQLIPMLMALGGGR